MISVKTDRVFITLSLATILAAAVMLRLFDPATSGIFPPCPFRFLTGWLCPGCGSLRAIHQLLIGNFARAFELNPFTVVSLPFLIYGMASYSRFVFTGRYLPRLFVPGACIRVLAMAIVVFGVVRNL